MPKVTFTETRTVNDGTGTRFEAGETYDLPTSSCERWIKRGAAQYAQGSGPEAEPNANRRPPRQSLNKITVEIGGKTGDAAPPPLVEIPADWADLPWLDLLALAKNFDAEARSKDDATAAVEKEIERRKAL